jgi:hypothetical protein
LQEEIHIHDNYEFDSKISEVENHEPRFKKLRMRRILIKTMKA